MGEEKEIISQKKFIVSSEGEIIETSRDVTPEKEEEKKKRKTPIHRQHHAEGVFRNPPNVPSPMDLELDRIREEKAHRARGKLLEQLEKAGLRQKTAPQRKEKNEEG